MCVVERLTAAEMHLRSPPLLTSAPGTNFLHLKSFACLDTPRPLLPYRRTNFFFWLPRTLSSRHFYAIASFRAPRIIRCAPPHSPGAPQLRPFAPFNFHRARVRRAGGFLQVVVSKARQHTVFVQTPCPIALPIQP